MCVLQNTFSLWKATLNSRFTATLTTCLCLLGSPRESGFPGAQHLHYPKPRTLRDSSYLVFKWSTIVAIVQPKNDFILAAGMDLRKEESILSVDRIPDVGA